MKKRSEAKRSEQQAYGVAGSLRSRLTHLGAKQGRNQWNWESRGIASTRTGGFPRGFSRRRFLLGG